jgi:hypothetical protein
MRVCRIFTLVPALLLKVVVVAAVLVVALELVVVEVVLVCYCSAFFTIIQIYSNVANKLKLIQCVAILTGGG